MSKFFSAKYKDLTPYVPGEQPKDAQYIKLNTNESPFPPPIALAAALKAEGERLQLYSDPESTQTTKKAAEVLGVKEGQVLLTNGSDEGLNFAFAAFCDAENPIVFPDITYGFYEVFAKLYNVPFRKIPLKEDFSVDYRDYCGVNANVVIANPNAPTGLCLSVAEVEEIVKSNPSHVVIVDEAYVDFGGESCVKLIDKYENLLVVQTFSKSRSLAGARLGMAIGCEGLLADLKTVKYSTNPYNVNRMTAAAGYIALSDTEWFTRNVQTIQAVREYTATELEKLGFTVLPSKANFLFVKTEKASGERLYKGLREKGVLVRHFNKPRIAQFVRVTVGTKAQMDVFLAKVKEIVEEEE